MLDIKIDKPVMITGAIGYVAGWIVKILLAAGLTVHAPIRNLSQEIQPSIKRQSPRVRRLEILLRM